MNHSIHEMASKGFETAGDAYERGRPEYPKEAIQFLSREMGITPGRTVIDLGAGTGKLTKLIASTGATIVAVEPVEGMRKKFSELLPQIPILMGSAEQIPMPDHSVDGVVVAQAFHWFDGKKALSEISRVLKHNGKLGLIWNARDESHDWVSKLTDIIDPHENGTPRYRSAAWREAFLSTSLFSPLLENHFRHVQKGAPSNVVDRIASISFISALDPAVKHQVLEKVKELLANHPDTQGLQEIAFPYRTDVFVCTKK